MVQTFNKSLCKLNQWVTLGYLLHSKKLKLLSVTSIGMFNVLLVDPLTHRSWGKVVAIFQTTIFKCFLLNKNIWILIKISHKFIPKFAINDIPVLVQIMAWHRPGEKPLSERMMVSLPTHICVTRPQWANLEHFAKFSNDFQINPLPYFIHITH